MNHYGVARDCAAVYNADIKTAAAQLPANSGKANFTIEIADADLCARYTSRIVRGVTIKPSPEKVAKRLTLLESRPINNVADATNYALWELGHPTHAFDLDKLEGKIIVRRAREGEAIKTLDGVDRKLTKDDLVIADAKHAVAIAGVMGGFDTMITDTTKNVLIESAWFDPQRCGELRGVSGCIPMLRTGSNAVPTGTALRWPVTALRNSFWKVLVERSKAD